MVPLRPSFLRLLRRSPGYLWTAMAGIGWVVVVGALGVCMWAVERADAAAMAQRTMGTPATATLVEKVTVPRADGSGPAHVIGLQFTDANGQMHTVAQTVPEALFARLPDPPPPANPANGEAREPVSVAIHYSPEAPDAVSIDVPAAPQLSKVVFGMAGLGAVVALVALLSLWGKYRLVYTGRAIEGRVKAQDDATTTIHYRDPHGRMREIQVSGRVNLPVVFLGRNGRAVAAASVFETTFLYQVKFAVCRPPRPRRSRSDSPRP